MTRSTPTTADLVLRGGRVRTVDPRRPEAEAVAVVGERIVAAGGAADIAPWIGSRTRVVDLAGRLLVPGFVDAHVHPVDAGVSRFFCNLHDGAGLADYQAAIVAWAAGHPEASWVEGEGWHMSDFPGGFPDRAMLDAVVPDRPAFFWSSDGHDGWVNSRALELAGIDATTADPPRGGIRRDADGQPTGILHEQAVDLVLDLLPKPTPEQVVEGLLGAQAHLHALGITGWQDARVDRSHQAAYETVAGRGLLTARVVGALDWDAARGVEQVAELLARRDSGLAAGFRATSVKIFADGIVENRTAALIEPYLEPDGTSSGETGPSMLTPEDLKAAAIALDAAGLQLHVHAIGERAVRETLDAVEASRAANGRSDLRPHIAHIQVIHPADVPRFAALGVVANAQPLWATHGDTQDLLNIPTLGPERSSWQYPFGSLVRAGARLAMGSDWSVSTPDPLREIEVAVTRVDDERRDLPPFYPDERIDLATALEAFTLGSAFVNHLDDATGSIGVGKLADLAVIDRDLFAPDAGPIGDARVLGTFVGGRAVFEDPTLG